MKDFEGFIKNYATRDFIYFFAEKSIEIYKNQVEKLDEHLVCNITFPLNIIQHMLRKDVWFMSLKVLLIRKHIQRLCMVVSIASISVSARCAKR